MKFFLLILVVSFIGYNECLFIAKRQVASLCSNSPCLNGGKCVQVGSNLAYCACLNGYSGATCNIGPVVTTTKAPLITTAATICQANICKNGGICREIPGSNLAYCECVSGYSGAYCDNAPIPQPVTQTTSSTSTAVPKTTTVSTTSTTTTVPSSICSNNLCKNGGQCVEIPGQNLAYCNCVNGYSGLFCDNPPANPVTTTSATTSTQRASTTTAVPTTTTVSTTSSTTTAVPTTTTVSTTSSTTTTVPTTTTISTTSSTTTAVPTTTTVSTTSSTSTVTTTSSTSTVTTTSSTSTAVPTTTTVSTTSTISTTSTSLLTTTTTAPKSNCPPEIPSPCINGGICVYSNETKSISCNCPVTYTGTFCESRYKFCDEPSCKNGGTCNQGPSFEGTCSCAPNFSGLTCDVALTCSPNPCQFDQTCLAIGGVAKCLCAKNYTGKFCETKLF